MRIKEVRNFEAILDKVEVKIKNLLILTEGKKELFSNDRNKITFELKDCVLMTREYYGKLKSSE